MYAENIGVGWGRGHKCPPVQPVVVEAAPPEGDGAQLEGVQQLDQGETVLRRHPHQLRVPGVRVEALHRVHDGDPGAGQQPVVGVQRAAPRPDILLVLAQAAREARVDLLNKS